jgi:metal-responsive CopG/Arc/MetJ family transcriptional regulator
LWNKVHSMETIQVVIDEDLLRATDRVAKRTKMKRSALVREALREYLKRAHYQELERRDRKGYEKHPDTGEFVAWEGVATWPEE